MNKTSQYRSKSDINQRKLGNKRNHIIRRN